jgi:limonene 1,2-monooxygenase
MFYEPPRMGFGAFVAPFHGINEDPTLVLERDIQLGVVLDKLGYDEYWIGEHHSTGVEIISSPELLIAAIAERTKHLRLGTGVNSLSYHHPLVLADRIVQLDHMTRGRIMFGAGPGQLVSDASMMGISPLNQRRMLEEALEVIMQLFRGETVTRITDWFKIHDGRLQLLPYQRPIMDVCVASAVTPSGPTLAGKLGTGMLSVAASSKAGFEALADHWAVCERAAARHGQKVSRDKWRVVMSVHVAETREQAFKDVEWGIMNVVHYARMVAGKHPRAAKFHALSTPEDAVRLWTTEGLEFGIGTIGTPDDVLAAVRRMQEQSGGFGTILLTTANAANFEATCKSFELFARYVRPRILDSNRNRTASLQWVYDNSEQFMDSLFKGMQQTIEKHEAGRKA